MEQDKNYNMDIKTIRKQILADQDALDALDRAVSIKQVEDPTITREVIVDKILLPIAFHESRMDPEAQGLDGKGKGLFQFEPKSLLTAANRTVYNLHNTVELDKLKGKSVPAYAKKVIEKQMLDASKLSVGQQAALLVYDFLQKPKANISNVTTGRQTINNFWFNNHWAGGKKFSKDVSEDRKAKFSLDYSQFLEETK